MRILVLLVAAIAMSTGTAVAQDAAEVEIFWDRNRDGVWQSDEPPYRNGYFAVFGPGSGPHPHYTDEHGKAKIMPGRWTVEFTNEHYLVTTTARAVLDPVEEDKRKLSIGVYGASICGTAWLDENADGGRQDAEPLIGEHKIRLETPGRVGDEREATTADDGSYCFRDLPTGDYLLTSADRIGIDKTTWGAAHWKSDEPDEDQVSKFDVSDGRSKVWHIDTPVTEIRGVDTAFVKRDDRDAQAVDITVVNDDGTTYPRDLKVGDRIKIIGQYRVTGTAYDNYAASLSLPEGLKIVGAEGTPATVHERRVVARFPERRAPEQLERVIAVAEVEKAFEHSEVGLYAEGDDASLGNNSFSVKIRALEAPRVPAQEDGSGVWVFLLGMVAGAGAVVGFLVVRRRLRR